MGGLQLRCKSVYIDSITVYGPLLHQHITKLEAVFARLKAVNINVRVAKTHIAQSEDFTLGHTFSAAGINKHLQKFDFITQIKRLQRNL